MRSAVLGTIAAGLLAVLWLLALGAGAQLPSPLSFAVLGLVLGTFWLTHVHGERPSGWHFGRLQRPKLTWLLWGLCIAVLLTAWRLLLALQTHQSSAIEPVSTWTLVAAVLAAPLIEEFGFRLWLQSQLERWLPALLAVVVASAAFAVVHDLQQWYLHAASGICFGLAIWLSGSIWVPVLMHALGNGALALLQQHKPFTLWFASALEQRPHWLDEATIGISSALLVGILIGGVIARRMPTRRNKLINGAPMKAIWNDTVIAESNDTVVVENNHYFPMASVQQALLQPSDTTSYCPWKGTANYYNLTIDGETNADAVWYYAQPKEAASEIKDHVAFWRGVQVTD